MIYENFCPVVFMQSIFKLFVLLFLNFSIPLLSQSFFGISQLIDQTQSEKMIHYSPLPKWVREVPIPKVKENQHSGFVYLLTDKQLHVPLSQTFYHVAKKLISPSSIEFESQVRIDFNPQQNKLKIHTLKIHRGRKVIDKLAKSRFKIIEEEEMADWLIFTEEKALLIFIDDVREGDILEYSYTLETIDPYQSTELQEIFTFSPNAFAKKIYCRLIANEETEITIRNYQMNITPKIQPIEGQLKEWIWEASDVDPIKWENDKPSWYNPHPHVQVSSFKSWKDVALHYLDFYKRSDIYDEGLIQKVHQWKNQLPALDEQILAAIRFVQNEIRYLSLHEGDEVTKAHDPALVLKRRYGDCKDKTVLLLTFLELLNVDACPALVNIEKKIDEYLPANIFNHVIVSFDFGGKRYFVDPTATNQGGTIHSLFIPNFQHALLLKENSEGLSEIPFANRDFLKQSFHISINTRKNSAQLKSKIDAFGVYADRLRSERKEFTISELKNQFVANLLNLYENVECKKGPIFQDKLSENHLSVETQYSIEGFAFEDQDCDYYELPTGRIFELNPEFSPDRKTPLRQSFPHNLEEEYCITLDRKLSDCFFYGIFDPISSKNDFFEYQISYSEINDYSFKLNIHLRTLRDWIEVKKLENYRNQIEKFEREIEFAFEVPRSYR